VATPKAEILGLLVVGDDTTKLKGGDFQTKDRR
jgi:hypothetical protein